jgi:DNA sulfur modification protein DndD
MLLETLTLCDFGVFRGQHSISLAPRKKYGRLRPLVLFGGLNGSGKTTILSAIRLALYGRQSMGRGTSQRAYEDYLVGRIHKSKDSLVATNRAQVALDFAYSKLGKQTRLSVVREWTVQGKQFKEALILTKDGQTISDLTVDQCQAFLNELIPIGVSELFFFDGEKIAELAEDTGHIALGDALRKLLGLDIIERLRNDLQIYVRRKRSPSLPQAVKEQIEEKEARVATLKGNVERYRIAIGELNNEISTVQRELGKLEERLSVNGGAWAQSRQQLIERRDELLKSKSEREGELRTFVAGLYPLCLVEEPLRKVRDMLAKEKALKEWETVSKAIKSRVSRLCSALSAQLPGAKSPAIKKAVEDVFEDFVEKPKELTNVALVHDLSRKDHHRVIEWIDEATNSVREKAIKLRSSVTDIDRELSQISLHIERAPDEEAIKGDLESVKNKNFELGQSMARRNALIDSAEQAVRESLELLRRIRALEGQAESISDGVGSVSLAEAANVTLKAFCDEITEQKIKKLESEFASTFARLSRKEDALYSAKIDPRTFHVHLRDANGREIAKPDLSAGEKQIFAIAMLDALGRTSGRNLPVIIDTPLGRLDSHHRGNLVNHYFPKASHQVIVLSTDTEVDQAFYKDLWPAMSHAYRVNYDEREGASKVEEGYFWRHAEEVTDHVA